MNKTLQAVKAEFKIQGWKGERDTWPWYSFRKANSKASYNAETGTVTFRHYNKLGYMVSSSTRQV